MYNSLTFPIVIVQTHETRSSYYYLDIFLSIMNTAGTIESTECADMNMRTL